MLKLNFYKNDKSKSIRDKYYIQVQINNLTIGLMEILEDKEDEYKFGFIDCKMIEADEDVYKIDEYEISFNEEFLQLLKDFNKSLKKTIKQFIVGRYTNDGELRDPFLDNNLKILMAQELDKILNDW